MSISYERCLLSRSDLCDGPITRPGGPTQCGVPECRLEASVVRRPWLARGSYTMKRSLLSILEFHTNILCFVRHI